VDILVWGIRAGEDAEGNGLSNLPGWFTTALQAPEIKAKLANQGVYPVGMCGADFGAFFRKQYDEFWPRYPRREHQGRVNTRREVWVNRLDSAMSPVVRSYSNVSGKRTWRNESCGRNSGLLHCNKSKNSRIRMRDCSVRRLVIGS